MDGVVRAPSAFSITLALLPSITATQEFVVPRSMPIAFAMVRLLYLRCIGHRRALPVRWCAAMVSSVATGHVGGAEERATHVSRYRLGGLKRLALPPTRRVP